MNNSLKTKIANKERPLGVFFGSASPVIMECLGRTGMDYVIIDNEHSPIEAETSAELIRAAELCGMTPLCRVREISRPAILKLLDVGAQGLIIPNVQTVDEVKRIISYAKYCPVGERGFCPTRKDGWGFDLGLSVPDTMAHINSQTLVIPQCETVGALESIEDIVALEGVDGIFVGPYDLSISMGMPGDFGNPVFSEAVDRIVKVCRDAGKFSILFAGTVSAVKDGYARGFDSMAYSIETSIFIDALKGRVDEIKRYM